MGPDSPVPKLIFWMWSIYQNRDQSWEWRWPIALLFSFSTEIPTITVGAAASEVLLIGCNLHPAQQLESPQRCKHVKHKHEASAPPADVLP